MKLPKNAKLAFKGEIFDVYQWNQKMYDGTTQKFEALKRPDTVLVIPVVNKRIIISKQTQPHRTEKYYSLLGGRRNSNESDLECAKRELIEESGITSKNWILLMKYMPVVKFDWTVYIYVAKEAEFTTEQKLDNGERIELLELEFNDFIKILVSGKLGINYLQTEIMSYIIKGELESFKNKLYK